MADTIRRPDAAALGGPVDLTKTPGTDLDTASVYDAAELLGRDLPEDLDGDRPFLPAWALTPAGRKAARRRVQRRTRRAVRRWLGRQRTERGHAAQLGRGARRTHEWVIGFHGVHVQAAAHQAHAATREARQAARRARYTVRGREQARLHAERAQTVAVAAVRAHKEARREVRRGRLLRAAIAYGAPLGIDATAYVESHWLGLAAALLLNLGGAAWLGRRPLAEESFDPERRSLGDGDPLTESMLDRAFVAAKLMTEGQRLRMVSPCVIDAEHGDAWLAVMDLPDGVTVEKVKAKHTELAGALGIARAQLDLRQVGGEGRLALWASITDPFDTTRRSPLIGRTEPLNTWSQGIPVAFDKRGRLIYMTISDYSMLIAGGTRSGKGMFVANILAGVALDPRVRIRLFDGKGTGEYVPHAAGLATFVRRNPARLVAFLRVMVGEMHRRTEVLVERGLSKASEDLIEELGGIELVIVDELATYTAAKGPSAEYAEEIAELLAQLAAVGAAVGIVLVLATQFPLVEIVPTRLRGNCGARMANRVDTPSASNTILGDGMAGQGYDSSKIPNLRSTRGRGWLTTPDTGVIEARSLFINEETGEIHQLIRVGIELRRKAGTLPGSCEDRVEAELLRVTGASSVAGGASGNGGIVRRTVLDVLADAAKARSVVTTAEAFTALAGLDSDRYGRRDGESDAAWSARCGKALRQQLADLGAELEATKVADATGMRTNGYTLDAITDAARNIRV
jgi:S-DNA-T family DNA segregation ATPase FtsK/SpoIIIE